MKYAFHPLLLTGNLSTQRPVHLRLESLMAVYGHHLVFPLIIWEIEVLSLQAPCHDIHIDGLS